MSLMKLNIKGREIPDRTLFKVVCGAVATFLLLILLDRKDFLDWVTNNLVIYIAVFLFLIPLAYGFAEEHVALKHTIMIAIGLTMLILYCLFANKEAMDIAISVIKAIVWATVFSIIFEQVKSRLEK